MRLAGARLPFVPQSPPLELQGSRGMAGAGDERGPGPAAGGQQQRQRRLGACQVCPEQLAEGRPQQGLFSSFLSHNQKCQLMLLKTLETSRSPDLAPGVGGVCLRPG